MITLIADSNALRHPGLKTYLASSRNHAIAISDLTLIEMRKRNALSTSRESLAIAAQFPMQIYALLPTHLALEHNIADASMAHTLIDPSASVGLTDLAADLQAVPLSPSLRTFMAEQEKQAEWQIGELREQVRLMEPGLLDATRDFSAAELTQIRTQKGLTDQTRRKVLDLLKLTTAEFMRTNQGRTRGRLSLKTAAGMFAFRYSLCITLYYLEWVRKGRQTGLNPDKRVNDVIDLQLAAMVTFFNGVLTADKLTAFSYGSASQLLSEWGAYVGERWTGPAT